MKKFFCLTIVALMCFALVACANQESTEQSENSSTQPTAQATASSQTENTEQTQVSQTPADTTEANALVVYFSWSGNTQAVANEIQSQTGADIFEIIPVQPYTEDYDALLDIAQEEQQAAARPEFTGTVEGLENVDVVYLGYPIWWGDMPMVLYTFLEEYDLAGKTIVPFVTSGGSGFSQTINEIKELEPDAEVAEGLALRSSEVENADSSVEQWLSDIQIAK